VMLLPMYFLIGVWGGPRREYAAIKFFLYTLFGSVFILIALLGFYFTDVQDFVHKDLVLAKQKEIDARKGAAAEDGKAPAINKGGAPPIKKGGGDNLGEKKKEPKGDAPKGEKKKGDGKGKAKDGKDGKKKDEGAAPPPASAVEKVEIHSFDIVVLAKVGKAAMQYMHLTDSAERDQFVESIVARRAHDGIPTTKAEVERRLSQAFFTPTFQYVMFLFL